MHTPAERDLFLTVKTLGKSNSRRATWPEINRGKNKMRGSGRKNPPGGLHGLFHKKIFPALNMGVALLARYEAVFALLLHYHYLINHVCNDRDYRTSQLASHLGQLLGLCVGAGPGHAIVPPKGFRLSFSFPKKVLFFSLSQMGIYKTYYLQFFFWIWSQSKLSPI